MYSWLEEKLKKVVGVGQKWSKNPETGQGLEHWCPQRPLGMSVLLDPSFKWMKVTAYEAWVASRMEDLTWYSLCKVKGMKCPWGGWRATWLSQAGLWIEQRKAGKTSQKISNHKHSPKVGKISHHVCHRPLKEK